MSFKICNLLNTEIHGLPLDFTTTSVMENAFLLQNIPPAFCMQQVPVININSRPPQELLFLLHQQNREISSPIEDHRYRKLLLPVACFFSVQGTKDTGLQAS
jgi:hypothetical protein